MKETISLEIDTEIEIIEENNLSDSHPTTLDHTEQSADSDRYTFGFYSSKYSLKHLNGIFSTYDTYLGLNTPPPEYL